MPSPTLPALACSDMPGKWPHKVSQVCTSNTMPCHCSPMHVTTLRLDISLAEPLATPPTSPHMCVLRNACLKLTAKYSGTHKHPAASSPPLIPQSGPRLQPWHQTSCSGALVK